MSKAKCFVLSKVIQDEVYYVTYYYDDDLLACIGFCLGHHKATNSYHLKKRMSHRRASRHSVPVPKLTKESAVDF